MALERRLAGIILHPTSLPGPYGIGDIGPGAIQFLDWMRDAGLAYWQVLPLGPTSFGDSPYQCFSAFAGNPLLVSPELLCEEGLLNTPVIAPPDFHPTIIDYGRVIEWKTGLLHEAHTRFAKAAPSALKERFEKFLKRSDVAPWLEDFALFMACKDAHGGQPWGVWEPALRGFKQTAVRRARNSMAESISYHKFAQFLFFDQWDRVRAACRERGIDIIGDAPIYVAYDSADTWANQQLFQLGADGQPTHVAGVPPDYFSETGQLWGNPLYKWDVMKMNAYAWWVNRMRSLLALADIVRLDHFRGFMGYWSVPFGMTTAEKGEWMIGPGMKFFDTIRDAFGSLPIIAEDLGEITADVTAARLHYGLPGMVVLQFAWGVKSFDPLIPDPDSGFLPYQHDKNSVVYSGTHDNDTTIGWWRNSSSPQERSCMQYFLSTDGSAANWDLIRAAFASVANTAIIPAQDFLCLDSEARMNFPGRAEGNWCWRLADGQLNPELANFVRRHTLLYGRCANPPEKAVPAPPKTPMYQPSMNNGLI
ncbi:MAG: 4-alpha-glucanotransferase [bacterium]|nr:4-alpha-glucanotransferase [Candidatus Sumerlaeota bacterium]